MINKFLAKEITEYEHEKRKEEVRENFKIRETKDGPLNPNNIVYFAFFAPIVLYLLTLFESQTAPIIVSIVLIVVFTLPVIKVIVRKTIPLYNQFDFEQNTLLGEFGDYAFYKTTYPASQNEPLIIEHLSTERTYFHLSNYAQITGNKDDVLETYRSYGPFTELETYLRLVNYWSYIALAYEERANFDGGKQRITYNTERTEDLLIAFDKIEHIQLNIEECKIKIKFRCHQTNLNVFSTRFLRTKKGMLRFGEDFVKETPEQILEEEVTMLDFNHFESFVNLLAEQKENYKLKYNIEH